MHRCRHRTVRALRGAVLCIGLAVLSVVLPKAATGQSVYSTPYTFTTLAGAVAGNADGIAVTARFGAPTGVAVDNAGNVFVADSHAIREITFAGTNRVVTSLSGLPGGPGVAVDNSGNIYASTYSQTICKLTPAGVMTTLAGLASVRGTNDGMGSTARFSTPSGVALDSAGNLYVADNANCTIRELTPVGTNWMVTTLAGLAGSPGSADGTGTNAQFNFPSGVAVDAVGNVYVADTYNDTIRKVTPAGVVTTLAGLAGSRGSVDGTGTNAMFDYPAGIVVDGAGNIYVADTYGFTIREISPAGVVTTLAGRAFHAGSADGTNNLAQFGREFPYGRTGGPSGAAVDSAGNLYVADTPNCTIREVMPSGTNWVVTTLAGQACGPESADGTGGAAQFAGPYGVAVDGLGNLYVADTTNCTIRKVTPTGMVTTLAGTAGSFGTNDGTGSAARFGDQFGDGPHGLAVDSAGNVYVADTDNATIRMVTPAGVVTTVAGVPRHYGSVDGKGNTAMFGSPSGVAVDGATNLYVADSANNTIRKVTPTGTNWMVTTLAGLTPYGTGSADGTGSAARFYSPLGVAVDSATNLYVADTGNSTIRKMTLVGTNWAVTTLAGGAGIASSGDGTGLLARFNEPVGLAVDNAGTVYVADTFNNTIRKVTPTGTNWMVTTLAGSALVVGSADGTGKSARFINPFGVAVDSAGVIYVADNANNTIRKGYPASSVPQPVLYQPGTGAGQFGFGMAGISNLAVDILSSSNLSSWQVVGNYMLVDGTNFFVPPASNQPAQFFRAHVR